MVVLRCPSRQWGDRRRGFLHKTEVHPEGSLCAEDHHKPPWPDGRSFAKLLDTRPELFKASKSGCDVSIGPNRFVGDLKRYHITAIIEEISVDIELTADVPAWRPNSGPPY